MHAPVLPNLGGDATAELGAVEVAFELPLTVNTAQASRYYMDAAILDTYGVESALVKLGIERSAWPECCLKEASHTPGALPSGGCPGNPICGLSARSAAPC